MERFNRAYRTKALDVDLFANLEQVQAITDQWRSTPTNTARTKRWAASRRCSTCPG
ncbi:hypothetical protein [Bordetella trematum]|uniref:hypothetical protein n=1 Tax=Bordetella trematum TaxID=123899 RepID=UPI0039A1BC6D